MTDFIGGKKPKRFDMNIAYNIDCMEYMKTIPDKYFDLAVVDPPYGGGANEQEFIDDEKGCHFHGRGRSEKYAVLHGGGQTSQAVNGQDSAECLTTTISANRTGGTWATKYRQRQTG